ncbi:M24 family metallopeptidase [Pseudobacteroides cellulosolvens]|uniref:Peptidase M24 n=1 Tax=Pseudobacteroides cellulosolvens ATCC 35603 = DSM 2933 TaxID=398512 RepID=A0A0L6JLU1_9FIRM|nr:aminopeptidase P family protein [Pseudobacteroides cellulosolvens]KNY26700.1 peptidase M24 [Pseudobacteroides cellulosolvens ATCC 35603 = DSM 2933]
MDNSSSIIENRLKRLREKLKLKDIDAVLINKRENYFYLSGFTGSSAYLLISQEDAYLVTDFRYVEQSRNQASKYEVIECNGNSIDALNEIIKKIGIKKLGFEENYLTYKIFSEYKSSLLVSELLPFGRVIDELRFVKDEVELEVIRKAVKIGDEAFAHIIKVIKPGIKEIEIAAEIEYHMKKLGASGPSFDTIVASGKRAAMPHGVASEKVIEMGDIVTLDYGCIYNNYCSDMTRTVFVGEPDKELLKIYEIVKKAQYEASTSAYRGLKGKDIDNIARSIIAERGYGPNFGHSLGHGVGIEIHEEPRLSIRGEVIMENGMVVTVEPGIYVEGLGGVRIEDIIVINDQKPEVLTSSTKEIIIL